MDVETISMPREEAKERLDEYRAALRRRADVEYERVAAGLEHLAQGQQLLVLPDVIAAAPRDERGRPRLAIARADRTQVRYRRERGDRRERFSTDFQWRRGGRPMRDGVIDMPATPATPPFPRTQHPDRPWIDSQLEGYALVPLVPPAVRGKRDLKRHFILWEVEAWADTAIGVDADRDPYLLERIDVDLYAIVGEWDLTEIERAITRGRREGGRS